MKMNLAFSANLDYTH